MLTPDEGRIELAARPVAMSDGPGIEVSVTDTGIGLSKEDQERIFRSFEQVESSTSRTYAGRVGGGVHLQISGSGRGLSMSIQGKTMAVLGVFLLMSGARKAFAPVRLCLA